MREHTLKCWPDPFDAVLRGIKRFEYRRNDRGFALADVLRLREYRPDTCTFTGRETLQIVTYVVRAGEFDVPEGYAILGIEPLESVGIHWDTNRGRNE